ncbi:MAG: shikimate kinase [Clostridia bacterium]|nr:shikimate kinase [Clostridia bacterium]
MNIVLIGMPGCGKSTVGVLLAKTLVRDFLDTDLLIQKEKGCSLSELIAREGTEAFKRTENDVILSADPQNAVVATGGSAVYGAAAMKKLKENGVLVYLRLPPAELEKRIRNIRTRGIAMAPGTTIAQLAGEREPLYERYADLTVDCHGLSAEECVERIAAAVAQKR